MGDSKRKCLFFKGKCSQTDVLFRRSAIKIKMPSQRSAQMFKEELFSSATASIWIYVSFRVSGRGFSVLRFLWGNEEDRDFFSQRREG